MRWPCHSIVKKNRLEPHLIGREAHARGVIIVDRELIVTLTGLIWTARNPIWTATRRGGEIVVSLLVGGTTLPLTLFLD